MTATCESCKWWWSWANGETGECRFPVPIWLTHLAKNRTYNTTEGCTAHQPKEPTP